MSLSHNATEGYSKKITDNIGNIFIASYNIKHYETLIIDKLQDIIDTPLVISNNSYESFKKDITASAQNLKDNLKKLEKLNPKLLQNKNLKYFEILDLDKISKVEMPDKTLISSLINDLKNNSISVELSQAIKNNNIKILESSIKKLSLDIDSFVKKNNKLGFFNDGDINDIKSINSTLKNFSTNLPKIKDSSYIQNFSKEIVNLCEQSLNLNSKLKETTELNNKRSFLDSYQKELRKNKKQLLSFYLLSGALAVGIGLSIVGTMGISASIAIGTLCTLGLIISKEFISMINGNKSFNQSNVIVTKREIDTLEEQFNKQKKSIFSALVPLIKPILDLNAQIGAKKSSDIDISL